MSVQGVKRSHKLLIGLLISLVTLGVAFGATAGDKNHAPEARKARMEERLNAHLDELNATDAQRAVIKKEMEALRPELRASRKAHKPQMKELKGIMLAGDVKQADRAHALVDDLSDARLKLAHQGADAAIRIHAILEPAQREQLASRLESAPHLKMATWFVDRGLDRMLSRLDATATQRKQVDARRVTIKKSMDEAITGLEPLRVTLAAQLRSPKPNVKLVHATMDQLALVMTNLAHDSVDEGIAMGAMLTPAQRDKIEQEMSKRRGHQGGEGKEGGKRGAPQSR